MKLHMDRFSFLNIIELVKQFQAFFQTKAHFSVKTQKIQNFKIMSCIFSRICVY